MAIGLEQIKKRKQERKANFSSKFLSKHVDDSSIKDSRGVRPWEGNDSMGPQVRTLTAQEAIRKAKRIVARNDRTSELLAEAYISPNKNCDPSDSKIYMAEKKTIGSKFKELVNYYLM